MIACIRWLVIVALIGALFAALFGAFGVSWRTTASVYEPAIRAMDGVRLLGFDSHAGSLT